MKVLFSELKTFLPKLKAGPKEVADAFTVTGIMVDQYKEVKVKGLKDVLLGLEVRQNRPDCLGVIGLARELSVYFKVPLELPNLKINKASTSLDFEVKAGGLVRRAAAIQLSGLDNSKPSPKWLVEALEMHGMNSVSFLVDISNYAMLMSGYPNHLFDADKVVGKLVWQTCPKDEDFVTLDGTVLQFAKGRELVISDNLGPLVMASAVGGRRSALSSRTTSVIAEVAVYDPKKVREDSRRHKVTTEASTRLEKQLAVEHVRWALEYLAGLLLENSKGQVIANIKDVYPKSSTKQQKIFWPLSLATKVGGVKIFEAFAKDVLKRLGFEPKSAKDGFYVTVPAWRSDVDGPADITEEVLRMYGFQNIEPVMPTLLPVPEVTPESVKLQNLARQILSMKGLDEVLTLPMTTSKQNAECGIGVKLEEVKTQNAVNEEYPVLRTGLVGGLMLQQTEFLKKGIEKVGIFEVGKVFWKSGKKYLEADRIGMLVQERTTEQALEVAHNVVDGWLRQMGADVISFEHAENSSTAFDNKQAFAVWIGEQVVGHIAALKPRPLSGNKLVGATVVAEFDLEQVGLSVAKEKTRGAVELLDKMAVLDVNLVLPSRAELNKEFRSIKKKYGKNLWSLEVVDQFQLESGQFRYTLRATYFGLSETAAKKLHSKIFSS